MKKIYNSPVILCHETHPLNLDWDMLAKDGFNPEEPRDEKGRWATGSSQTLRTPSETQEPAKNLSLIIPEDMPPDGLKLLQEHMATARLRCRTSRNLNDGLSLEDYWWFYTMVHSHAPWDYKTRNRNWEDFGNFHYGAIGTACGFSEQTLLRAAGAYQEFFTKNTQPDWRHAYSLCNSPLDKDSNAEIDEKGNKCAYGDDPKDQNEIKRGIIYARQLGY